MEKIFASAKDLKEGKYILIDGVPCRIVNIEKSKPGKHGAAKMRITAIGIFDGQKKQWLGPSDQDIEIPIIERSSAQILSVNGSVAQLMDMKTYETFELPIPEEFLAEAQAGKEAELIISMGKRAIQRIK
ncbi:MAG: translation initiation factor IF-5A [Candidatus Micrarchaeota archaeon]|nr:translation initiation factor IF-5A [Candidatus Micrarchaeota archaeon]